MNLPKPFTPTIPFSKYLIAFFLLVAFVLIGVYTTMRNQEEVVQELPEPQKKEMAFTDFVPNYESLTLDDLPNFHDVRRVFSYNDRLIIVGANRIIDYDPATKTVIRMNSADFSCIHTAALIHNTLYIACNGDYINSVSYMYEIDLDSGFIINTTTGIAFTGHPFMNPEYISQGVYLWGASRSGVFKYNTIDKTMKFYTPSELDFTKESPSQSYDCATPDLIFIEDSVVKVTDHNCDTVSAYDEQTDLWHLTNEKGNLSSRINLIDTDFDINIPDYFAVSPLIENKRYLFADTGIYTLKSKGFPIVRFDVAIPNYRSLSSLPFIDADEKYALLVGTDLGGPRFDPTTIAEELYVYYVDLETGELTDLVSTFSEKNRNWTEYGDLQNLGGVIEYNQVGNIVHVQTEMGTKLLSIDIDANRLQLYRRVE